MTTVPANISIEEYANNGAYIYSFPGTQVLSYLDVPTNTPTNIEVKINNIMSQMITVIYSLYYIN